MRLAVRKVGRQLVYHALLITIIGFMMLPIVIMLGTSLKTYDEVFVWPPSLVPSVPQWQNYVDVWAGQYQFWRAVVNSTLLAGGTSIIACSLGVPAAYALSRLRFRYKNVILIGVLAVSLVSPVVFVVPLFQLLQAYQLLDTLLAAILPTAALALPMIVWLMHGFFQTVPEELEEAALVDGCGRFGAMLRITLPLAAPGIVVAATYAFIRGWDELLFPLAFITNADLKPVTLSLYAFEGYNITFWHELMAASAISIFPVAILFAIVQRHMVRGLTAGALK